MSDVRVKKSSNPLDELGVTVIGGILDGARTLLITGPVAILTIGAGIYLFAAYWKLVVAAVALVLIAVFGVVWYEGLNHRSYRGRKSENARPISLVSHLEENREDIAGRQTHRKAIDLVGSELRAEERRAKREADRAAAEHVKRASTRLAPFFYLPAVRPSSGRELFAYTEAWLVLAGLFQGGQIKKTVATEVAGNTAIGYHLGLANFRLGGEAGDLISLTDKGLVFFESRRGVGHKSYAPPGDVKAWIEFFTKGTGPKAK
jgi:hypothetical protein